MRTPPRGPKPGDDDFALVAGFCFTDGIYDDFVRDVKKLAICDFRPPGSRILVELSPDASRRYAAMTQRTVFKAQTSCGLCGKQSEEEIHVPLSPVAHTRGVTADELFEMERQFDIRQSLYRETRTSHAAALFAPTGVLVAFAEDVGRHNAMDKAIGRMLLAGQHTGGAYLALLSSRISFEMMQKAVRFGVEVVVGVSAATSSAVALAERYGTTLIGMFGRNNSFVVYTHAERITPN
eukprot:TRINITY_DN1897_c0_g1_i2.p1 TRINITY_DN1897_c0_g1~~TRINITY_DN1897_c0_g1_i2.p1  ORF type:complete len:237 (-),score=43.94 TRINITY_DN1897_c0_g1_i2:51-761(-)